METGFILYIMDSDTGDVKFDPDRVFRPMKERADGAQILGVTTSRFSLVDAWNQLMDKGVDRVVLMLGKMVSESKVILSGHEIRMSDFDISKFSKGLSIH